jgi:hypothetical protein
MTDYGVTPTGFVKKDLSVLKSEIGDDLKDDVNSKLNLLDTSVLGQIIGVFGDKLRESWDVKEAIYRSMYPDSASAEALDEVASITGATRLGPEESEVTLDQLWLDAGVTLNIGDIAGVGTTGTQFALIESVTNSTSYPGTFSAVAQATATGELIGPANEIDTIVTPVSGWSAAPALTNTVDENYLLDGTSLGVIVDEGGPSQLVNFTGGNPWTAATASAEIDTQLNGGTAYAVGTKVRIATESEGSGSSIWVTGGSANSILQFSTTKIKGFNSEDASLGRDAETDPEFRARREQLLRVTGAASVEALRSAVLDLAGMLQAFVLENDTNVTNSDGLPPHSFEAIAQQTTWTAAEEQEMGDTLWQNKAAGIKAYGSENTVVTDSMGFDHDLGWSKPTEVVIHIELTLTTDDDYPSNGDDQVKAALVAFGDTLEIGEDVIALQFRSVPLDVAGVVDVTVFKIDTVDPPVGTTNITINARSLATFDSADIDIV